MKKLIIAYLLFLLSIIFGFLFMMRYEDSRISTKNIEVVSFQEISGTDYAKKALKQEENIAKALSNEVNENVSKDMTIDKIQESTQENKIQESPQDIASENEIQQTTSNQAKTNLNQRFVRILIKNSNYQGIYHDTVVISGTQNIKMQSEIRQNQSNPEITPETINSKIIPQNTEYTITEKDFKNDSLFLIPENDGEIYLKNVKRKDELSYGGSMELFLTKNGIVIVNEIPMEEYVASVVPSEMPAAYPVEALKAQAVVARSYAYFHRKEYAYPEYRAHMDDSTSFQVYKNVAETETTKKCVKDTKNMVVSKKQEVMECMYYSTSPGSLPQKELSFAQKIRKESQNDIENKEGWYRWSCEYTIDFSTLKSRLAVINSIDDKEKQIVEKSKKIKKLSVSKRGQNGRVEEITLKTDAGNIHVKDQYVIRKLLAIAGTVIEKKDGSTFRVQGILPSPYFYFNQVNINENDIFLRLKGGGFGHGEGLSQNGAKVLALQGKDYKAILSFYYK